MPKEVEFDCTDGRCTWRWDANAFDEDWITLRIRHRDGGSEIRRVRNTGTLVLPEDDEVEEILSTGKGARGRRPRWRGPGG